MPSIHIIHKNKKNATSANHLNRVLSKHRHPARLFAALLKRLNKRHLISITGSLRYRNLHLKTLDFSLCGANILELITSFIREIVLEITFTITCNDRFLFCHNF